MTYDRAPVPVDDRIGTRKQRRVQVATLYGAYLIGCAAYAATYHAPWIAVRVAGLVIVIAAFFAGSAAFWLLMRRTFVNAPNISDRDLDERQRERTYHAMRAAYPVLGLMVGCVPLYVTVASTAERWTILRDATLIADLSWALFLIATTLPTAIMAWTEPDPLGDS